MKALSLAVVFLGVLVAVNCDQIAVADHSWKEENDLGKEENDLGKEENDLGKEEDDLGEAADSEEDPGASIMQDEAQNADQGDQDDGDELVNVASQPTEKNSSAVTLAKPAADSHKLTVSEMVQQLRKVFESLSIKELQELEKINKGTDEDSLEAFEGFLEGIYKGDVDIFNLVDNLKGRFPTVKSLLKGTVFKRIESLRKQGKYVPEAESKPDTPIAVPSNPHPAVKSKIPIHELVSQLRKVFSTLSLTELQELKKSIGDKSSEDDALEAFEGFLEGLYGGDVNILQVLDNLKGHFKVVGGLLDGALVTKQEETKAPPIVAIPSISAQTKNEQDMEKYVIGQLIKALKSALPDNLNRLRQSLKTGDFDPQAISVLLKALQGGKATGLNDWLISFAVRHPNVLAETVESIFDLGSPDLKSSSRPGTVDKVLTEEEGHSDDKNQGNVSKPEEGDEEKIAPDDEQLGKNVGPGDDVDDGKNGDPGDDLGEGKNDVPGDDLYDGKDGVPDDDLYDGKDGVPDDDLYDGKDGVPDDDLYDGKDGVPDDDLYDGKDGFPGDEARNLAKMENQKLNNGLPPPEAPQDNAEKPKEDVKFEVLGADVGNDWSPEDSSSGFGMWHFLIVFLLIAAIVATGYVCSHNRKKIREGVGSYISDSRGKRSRNYRYQPLNT